MINLQFHYLDGDSVMAYDVHPASQESPIRIPPGAVSVTVWLGTEELPGGTVEGQLPEGVRGPEAEL